MKIVIVSDWLAEKMGYSENLLPKALAKLGPEVHLVTSDLQPPFPNYKETYEPFLGPRIQPLGVKRLNGFTVHRLPHRWQRHNIYINGLHHKLADLRPDIVQCFTLPSFCTYQSAFSKLRLGYKLFLEEHTHRSVLPDPTLLRRRIIYGVYRVVVGKFISAVNERCYPIAPDAAEIVTQYYGYDPRKVQICSLGVDTDSFSPPVSPEQLQTRQALREKLGFKAADIVCLYSGRFTHDKDPQCLARAIDLLQEHAPQYKGLFIGNGTPDELAEIKACKGCIVHPFVEWWQLPDYYRAADIGVWPRQESTSQLDAAATGLPIILSDQIRVRERVEGNGLLYKQGDSAHLAQQLLTLCDTATRQQMGEHGVQKIKAQFSWDHIAQQRLEDYKAALEGRLQ